MSHNTRPQFELQSIYDDGTASEPEIVTVTDVPLDTRMDRRGVLGLGSIFGGSVGAALLLNSASAGAQDKAPAAAKEAIEAPRAEAETPTKPKRPPAKVRAHRKSISTMTLSSDGQFLVSGDRSGNVKLWSIADAKLKRKVKAGFGAVLALALSPDARSVTIVMSGSLSRWSLVNGRNRRDKAIRGGIKSAAFAPDRSYVVLSMSDGRLQLHRLDVKTAPVTIAKDGLAIDQLAISADGRTLVASKGATVELYALPDLRRLTQIATGYSGKRHVAVSPRRQFVAVARERAYGAHKRRIAFWQLPDAKQREKLEILDAEAGPLYSFITTGKKLQIGALSGSSASVSALAFSPSEPFLVSGERRQTRRRRRRSRISRNRRSTVPANDQALHQTIKVWSTDKTTLLQSLAGNERVTDLKLDKASRVMASSGADGTIMIWDRKDSATGPGFEFRTFLFDPGTMDKKDEAVRFDRTETATGQTISYTLPCGSPIPPGAVCTCNCVAGSYTRPVRSRRTRRSYTYCRCNKVCTCIPVCQAHKLLHSEPIVRRMAEQLLLIMGRREFGYMQWAAEQSEPHLRGRIRRQMTAIRNGAQPDRATWPTLLELEQFLDSQDEVVAIMAAQMCVQVARATGCTMTRGLVRRVDALLDRSEELAWPRYAPRPASP